MVNTVKLVEQAYLAFNARDIDRALGLMTEDVRWPKASESGNAIGRAEIRAYWTRQWSQYDPRVEPTAIEVDGNQVLVSVHQVVRDLAGEILSESTVVHLYTIRNGLIAAMDLGHAADAHAAFRQ